MKKLNYLFAFFLLLALTSCEEILDVKPSQSIASDDAVTDKKGVERALIGCYNALQSASYYGREYIVVGDLTADNLTWTGTTVTYSDFDNNTISVDNGIVDGIWASCYYGINCVNNLVKKIDNVELTSEDKNNYLGELYFLRALMHFDLVRCFGDIPIKTQPSESAGDELLVSRQAVSLVYNAIVSDLLFAEANISNTTFGRATQAAAKALLARVYLYMKDYAKAKAKAAEVISTNGQLAGSYAELFNDNENAELIFSVIFNEQDQNRLAQYFFPTSLSGRNEYSATDNLLNEYESGDLRKDVCINATDKYVQKYSDLVNGGDNVCVIRLAEMYLIRAEAETRLNGDLAAIRSDINTVRLRAGLSEIITTDYAKLLEDIEHEHRIEFAFEGHRWFDLVRTDRAISLIETVTDRNKYLFPIPASEMNANENIGSQNPGY